MSKYPMCNHHVNFYFLGLFIFLAALFSGCGSDNTTKQLSAEDRFTIGMKAFNDEDYLAAIDEFKVVSLQYQGSKVADSAQYYMAECRFKREEYILAAFEYDIIIRTMPYSVFVPRARFARATCYFELSPESYLDQEYTKKAIDEYQAFLEYNPADTLAPLADKRIRQLNTKLAKKDYESGITYMHMEYYKAATYYFDLILDKYHDTEYAEPAMFRKAEALVNRKRYAEAKETIEKFREKYPASPMISDAAKMSVDIDAKILEEKAAKQKKLQVIKELGKQAPQPGI